MRLVRVWSVSMGDIVREWCLALDRLHGQPGSLVGRCWVLTGDELAIGDGKLTPRSGVLEISTELLELVLG